MVTGIQQMLDHVKMRVLSAECRISSSSDVTQFLHEFHTGLPSCLYATDVLDLLSRALRKSNLEPAFRPIYGIPPRKALFSTGKNGGQANRCLKRSQPTIVPGCTPG